MDIKEQIHGLTEEMLTNLGRLVAIDSQLGRFSIIRLSHIRFCLSF